MEQEIIHTFLVLAYKESPYLENAVKSVLNQEYPSKVVIGTSTDNEYIRSIADKYHLDVIVNPVKNGGNTGDFDFGWSHGNNTIVNIDKRVYHNLLLNVKKTLLLPLSIVKSSENKSMKQSCLRFGTAICCPAVSYVPSNIPFDKVFRQDEFVGVADWYGWYKLSNVDNTSFTYIPKPLMGHRVHEGSHTSREIHSDIRSKQELEMFKKFWPEGFAKFLNHFYRKAQYSN